MHPLAIVRDRSDRTGSAEPPALSLSEEASLTADELALLSAWRAARSASAANADTDRIVIGDIIVDRASRTVIRAGRYICLSPKEFELLIALGTRAEAAVDRDVLMREVWNGIPRSHSRTLDQHISQLRQKIEDDPHRPACIVTVSKFGYRLTSRRPQPIAIGGP